jgi:4-hydroxybenzoate polyprenyltransferase
MIGLAVVTAAAPWDIPSIPKNLGKTWAARVVLISALTAVLAASAGIAVAARGIPQYVALAFFVYWANRICRCLVPVLERSFRARKSRRN